MPTPDAPPSRLDAAADPCPPVAVMAQRLDWDQVGARIGPLFVPKQERQVVEGLDLFGPTPTPTEAPADGHPRLPLQLMVSLLYLKQAYGESDDSVCERWSENVMSQFFSGMAYYTPKLLLDPNQFDRPQRLLEVVRQKAALTARRAGLKLKLSFEKEWRQLRRRAGCCVRLPFAGSDSSFYVRSWHGWQGVSAAGAARSDRYRALRGLKISLQD